MNDDSLGLNHLLSFPARCQTVTPRSSALSSGHLSTAPPQSASGMPRCCWYHEANAALSPLLLRNTPPIPVIFAIVVSCPVYRLPFGPVNVRVEAGWRDGTAAQYGARAVPATATGRPESRAWWPQAWAP